MAMEFQIITSHEFFRLGTHGELDWTKSLDVLSTLVEEFIERGTDLALLDVRDTQTDLSDTQIECLVLSLKRAGIREYHRVAILHRPRPHPRATVFVTAAREHGFDVGEFDSYELAVEWLSASKEKDPDFDREVYEGPKGKAESEEPETGSDDVM